MIKTCLLLSLLVVLSVTETEAEPRFQWSREINTSSLRDEELIAVPLDSEVYKNTQDSLEDLVIQNSDGDSIPFLVRKQKEKISRRVKKKWKVKNASLKPVEEVGLEIRFELDADDPQPDGLTILTPLKNFEQRVQIFSVDEAGTESTLVDDALIMDYSRFMDVRTVHISFASAEARRFRVTIDQPTSQQQSQLLELTRELQGGKEVSQTTRTNIDERAFRIDGIQLWADESESTFRTVDEHPSQLVETKISLDKETNETVIDMLTNGEPLKKLTLATPSRNFQRFATLFELTMQGEEEQLHQIAYQSIKRFEFRDLQEEQLSLTFQTTRHRHLRLTIRNHDNPPLDIETVQAYGTVDELVFFADPGEQYSLWYGNERHQKENLDTAAIQAAVAKKLSPVSVSFGPAVETNLVALPPAPLDLRAILNNPFLIGAVVLVMIGVLVFFLYSAAQKIELASDDAKSEDQENTP